MNQYQIRFDFTTATKTGRFTGRNGFCYIESELSLVDIHKDLQAIQSICAEFIHIRKPKWNIFMITVTSVVPVEIKEPINQ